MGLIQKGKGRIRNAEKARNSFVTRKAEIKVDALVDIFKLASGGSWEQTRVGKLYRKLIFSGFRYLDTLRFMYNWENRFLSVNYNLQMIADLNAEKRKFEETGNCHLVLDCTQKGLAKAKREFDWEVKRWDDSQEKLEAYLERLNNPLIKERLYALDIMEMEITYTHGDDHWHVSCESLIGSATWILIPPVLSMITPKLNECVKFYELYELLGDALINNKM